MLTPELIITISLTFYDSVLIIENFSQVYPKAKVRVAIIIQHEIK